MGLADLHWDCTAVGMNPMKQSHVGVNFGRCEDSHTRSVELTTPLNFRQRSAIQDLRHRERTRVNTAALSCVCDGGRETNVDYYNNVEESSSEGSFLSDGSSSSSDSTITLESTKAWKRQLIEGPPDSSSARDEDPSSTCPHYLRTWHYNVVPKFKRPRFKEWSISMITRVVLVTWHGG
ncbi:hypothetical protein NQZ68_001008 [Dissostichus eleginoides]|nr:hypothetical protein NQZ68_001008 [Dissostichus eleginoides]